MDIFHCYVAVDIAVCHLSVAYLIKCLAKGCGPRMHGPSNTLPQPVVAGTTLGNPYIPAPLCGKLFLPIYYTDDFVSL